MHRLRLRTEAGALLALGTLLVVATVARGQEYRFTWEADRAVTLLQVRPDSLRLHLPSGWILTDSFRLTRRDTLLVRGVDYLLDPRRGAVRLLRQFPAGTELRADYHFFPVPVTPEYARRAVIRVGEEAPAPGPAAGTGATTGAGDEGVHLDVRGSKTFAVEVGTRRDLSLQQSLDLTVDGRLGRDTRVRAVLSDRRTPLEADGTSSRIGDLDRVRVEVEGRSARMVLGDLTFAVPPSEFLRFDRRLQGAQAEVTPGRLSAFALGATAPGTYATREFFGQEGKQGPYLLAPIDTTGSVGGVVPGSERVWLDGNALRRGESDDYLMDYAEGTLTFTGRHPITAYSEVTVEYQVALDRYRRSVYGGGVEWKLGRAPGRAAGPPGARGGGGSGSEGAGAGYSTGGGSGVLSGFILGSGGAPGAPAEEGKVRLTLLSEGDDRSRPLFPLTAPQRAALGAAGDSITAGLASGVRFVGAGNGEYDRVSNDTLAVSFFLWTGPARGSYLVRFDAVGENQGDYRDTTGVAGERFFVYAGSKRGSYLPGTEVPRPQRTTIASLAVAPRLGGPFRVRGEASVSDFDANTFSTKGDRDNRGAAWLLEGGAGPFPAGPVALSLRGGFRETEPRFRPLDRLDPAFYARDWNVDAARLDHGDRRRLVEGTAATGTLRLSVTGEDLDNLRDYRGRRGTLAAGLRRGSLQGDARVVRVTTRDRSGSGEIPGARAVDRASLAWNGSALAASARYAHEQNEHAEGAARTGDSFQEGSLRLGTGSNLESLRASLELTRRVRRALQGTASPELDTGDTGLLEAQWTRSGGRLLAADVAARELRPPGGARQSSRVGRVRWLERAGGDAFLQEGRWELTTSARTGRDKEIRFVGASAGRYDSLGTYVGVGNYEIFYRDRSDSARVNRMDFSLRNEYDAGREAGRPAGSAAAGGWERLRRGLHLVHTWTAGIETLRGADWFWPRLFPVLAGAREVPFAEVRMTSEGSALPDARWFSPRLRWDRHRAYSAVLTNETQRESEDSWSLRFRSRPGDRATIDTEGEWESITQVTKVSGIGSGRDGWRSIRARVEPQVRLRSSISSGIEAWARRRARVGSRETARVVEATPYLIWTPRLRSRIEVRVTRTAVDRRGGVGSLSRLLELPGWNARIVATLRLREELDLTAWYRERRPDHGARDVEGRMELRASF